MLHSFLVMSFLCFRLAFAQPNPALNSHANEEGQSKSDEQKEKLRSPRETMHTFMTAMDRLKKGSTTSFDEAILTLDLSEIDQPLRELTGKITAERLINTIDRIAKINYEHIPSHKDGPTWFFRKQTVLVGDKNYDVEIAIAKTAEGVWKITPETINSIENFYSSVAHSKVVDGVVEYHSWPSQIRNSMPAWSSEEFLILKKGQWIGFIFLLFISFLFFGIVRFVMTNYLRYQVRQKKVDFGRDDPFKSTRPFGLLAFSLTWLAGIRFLEFDVSVFEFFMRIAYVTSALFMVWSALKMVDYISLYFEKMAERTTNKFDDILVPMLKTTSKVLVVAFGALLVANSLTFDVAGILAGLGIGGVAIAFAAKDTIANLFGSVTVLMDRPFQIGDYISLEKKIEGTVEQVGFRSTRLRTPYNSLITLPNSVLANMAIDNYGMRRIRRYKTFVQLKHSTPIIKIEEFCDKVRVLIQENSLIRKDNAIVSLFEISSSSIDIMVVVFFATEDYKIELSERHQFIGNILKIAHDMNIEFATDLNMKNVE